MTFKDDLAEAEARARAALEESRAHEMYVSYTNDDDGVRLYCACGKLNNPLGYRPTIAEIAVAVGAHLEEVGHA
jgi:hypothetical protein